MKSNDFVLKTIDMAAKPGTQPKIKKSLDNTFMKKITGKGESKPSHTTPFKLKG